MTPNQPIRALLLEDSAVDAELICRQLLKVAADMEVLRAAVRTEFEAQLASGPLDIILSDYLLPDLDGRDALALARVAQPGVPFVFVSGVLGEERATEALRAGATDYVTKRDLARIPMVVGRALQEASERLAAREATRAQAQSEARYRSLFNSIDAGFCIIQVAFDAAQTPIDYRFVEVNPAFERQTGLVDATGKWVRELVPDHEQHWFDAYGHIALTGEPARFERAAEALGDFWYDVFAYRIGEPEDRTVAVLFNDIAERRLNEEALKESEAHYRYAAELNPQVAWTATPDGRLDRVAERWAWWTGLSGLGEGWMAGLHPDDRAPALDAWRASVGSGQPYDVEHRVRRVSGDYRWARSRAFPRRDDAGRIVRWYGTTEDVHEQKLAEAELRRLNDTLEQRIAARTAELVQAQEALRQSQKLEAMGQLTGGVAHDFNNLLTPIIASLDILQRRGLADERTQRLVEGALQAAERAKMLVQRLLAFARRQPLQRTAVDLRVLVDGMGDLISSTSGPRIRVLAQAEEGLPPAYADANQIEMAILNLAVNARDAMPDGGTLTVSATSEAVAADHRSKLGPGTYLRLSVADTGTGMDAATLARAVEPFFSTKGIGKGTGLGLSMVHGLAGQLGGALTLQSRPGLGTRADLWLPVAEGAVAVLDKPAEASPVAGEGTALLVDDEQLVRASTAEMLRELGYGVVEVSSAEAALRTLEQGLKPSVLVTDHLMPGMTGAHLAAATRGRYPGLPVLLVSGYAEDHGISPDLARLNKPFRRDELSAALSDLLGTPRTLSAPARARG